MSSIEFTSELPSSWVRYLIKSERRLFFLSAAFKTVYSATLIGITILVLEMIDLSKTFKNEELYSKQFLFCFWFLLVAAIFCFSSQGNSYFAGQLAGKVKARLAALVTEETILRASPEASARATALTLASADAHTVCEGALAIHELWLAPINIFTVVVLLISRAGFEEPWGYIGGGMCVAVLLVMSYVSILLVRARKEVSNAENNQASVFVEIIENIRTLRFYGWDSYMLRKLHAMSDAMVPLRRNLIFLKMLNIGTSFIVSPLMVYVLISSFALSTGKFNRESNFLFLVQSLFDITKYALLALPSAVRASSGAAAAYARILEYLQRPPFDDRREIIDGQPSSDKPIVQLINLPAGPSSVIKEWHALAGSLWVFQGPVRSFKTTLLEGIAGHYTIPPGSTVKIGGRMSYAPQTAWLLQTSIRDNIVCCEPWDEARYKAVVHACALEQDFKNMMKGDLTPIAEKGISLSGGQKQRVGLARAAYRRADIYLLDNPISALDDQTQEHIWTHLLEGLLQHATIIVGSSRPVISCTAVLHLTPDGVKGGDPTYFNGWCSETRLEAVPPRYAQKYNTTNAPVYTPVNAFNRTEAAAEHRAKSVEGRESINKRASSSRSRQGSSRNGFCSIEEAAVSDVAAEVSQSSKSLLKFISEAFVADSSTNADDVSLVPLSENLMKPSSVISILEDANSRQGSMMGSRRSTAFASVLSSTYPPIDEHIPRDSRQNHQPATSSPTATNSDMLDFQPSPSQNGFLQWISACAVSRCFIFMLLGCYALNQAGRSYFAVWATWWNSGFFGLTTTTYHYVFLALLLAQIIFRILTDYLIYSAGTNGSQRMRKAFCASVLKAPMSFFMTENLGPIIQVFSRDMSVVSEDLIDSFHYAMLYSFITLAIIIRTVQDMPLFCVVGFPLLMIAALILNNYNKKLKSVKSELKTANDELFHAIADSIEGVKVLRTADGTIWAIDLLNEAFRNARIAIVASENCNIWLMRRLDPISTFLAFLTLIMTTQINTKQFPILPPNIQSVYIQQSLAYLVFVQWSLKAMGMFVYNLGTVERIHQYIKDIPQERSGSNELDPSWPKSGEVEYNRICLKYAPHLPLALNNVTFKLSHGAKVGVVGRTGSGKSTLLVSLFRLMQPCDGDMKVAGTSITDARVNSLRQQLSIVPQEPVMFSGTLRENVDPLCLYTDDEVRVALQQAGLGSKVLGSAVGVSGAGWSLGEKQLVCLARVLLKKPAVLLLDEATAALDEKTEELFQRVLEEKFVDTTIICIAHRLETLRWCKTRIEMSNGSIASISDLQHSNE